MELLILLTIVAIVIGAIVYLNVFYQSKPRHLEVDIVRPGVDKKCALTTIRGDTCQRNEYRPCSKVGSYEQCTNNVAPASKCVCSNQRGFELCDPELQISDKCYMDEYFKRPNLEMEIQYKGDSLLPRVNRHPVELTPFDEID